MDTSASAAACLDSVRPDLHGVAKSLVERLYGPAGPPPGTTLSDIEVLLTLVRQTLTEEMLHLTLDHQAQALTAVTTRCPGCQLALDCDQHNPRLVQTEVGAALWNEPQAYCPRCRRAFFPSEQEPRH